MYFRIKVCLILFLAVFILLGCRVEQDYTEVEERFSYENVEVLSYSFIIDDYNLSSDRNPFSVSSPIVDSGLVRACSDDLVHNKYLYYFGLAELLFLGFVHHESKYALIKDPFNNIHTVKIGDSLGRENARVDDINAIAVELIFNEEIYSGTYVKRRYLIFSSINH